MEKQVSEIMTTDLVTVNTDDGLLKAQELFDQNQIRHLPVVESEKLVGILSKTDLMRLSFGSTYGENDYDVDNTVFEMLTIGQVMKNKPVSVSPEKTVRQVAEMLTEEEFHALPVVDQDKLVGLVTTTDIIKHLLQ